MTDSTAYLKEADALRYGVKVIPVGYTVDGREYYETYSDKNGDFEALFNDGADIATIQPDTAGFLRRFNDAGTADGILCVTISSRLSGIYSAACAAARQANVSVTVFDSRLVAGGLFILVKKAAEMIKENVPMNEIVGALEEMRERINVVFSVADINPLRNSRRIGFVRRGVETILNRKPILYLKDGAVEFGCMASGNTEVLKRLKEAVNPGSKEIVVNYLGNGQIAADLYGVLKKEMPGAGMSLSKFGPVLAAHLGLGITAVSFL
jgi:DegV family protein with EDD domain